MVQPALFSSENTAWNTPSPVLYRVCSTYGPVGLDPCSNPQSIVGAAVEWSLENGDDGLASPWGELGPVFCNPPYSRGVIDTWAAKMALEGALGAEIIGLIPARVDTNWFRSVYTAQAICFWAGRIKFLGAASGAPFPSALPYFGPNVGRFYEAFKDAGKVLILD